MILKRRNSLPTFTIPRTPTPPAPSSPTLPSSAHSHTSSSSIETRAGAQIDKLQEVHERLTEFHNVIQSEVQVFFTFFKLHFIERFIYSNENQEKHSV